jgi:hypothetical protein
VEITGHMKDGGTIECVRYDKDSRYSPYWVLVRNPTGATMEIGLAFLTIDEVQDGKA